MTQAKSLDDRVLGAGTTLRFVLLLMMFAAGSAAMTSNVVTLVTDPGNMDTGCLLADGVNPAGGLWSGLAALDYGNDTALSRCFAQYVPNVS